jgi:protease-4
MILLRLVAWILAAIFLPLRLLRRARAVPRGAWIHLVIDGPVADVVSPRTILADFLGKRHSTSLYALGELVDAMAKDDKVRGILITLRALGGGMATATSMRAILQRAKDAGKEVVFLLPLGGDTSEIYVASVAHRIFVGPQATLAPVGFSRSVWYLKHTLEKAGVEADVLACGKYKSAGEQLVLDKMSDAQREQIEAVFDLFHGAVVDAIADGRKFDRARAEAIVDDAPYRARRAREVGLVDGAAYEDEMPEVLGAKGKPVRLLDATWYLKLRTKPLMPRLRRPPVVGVIPVHGPIAGAAPGFSAVATDERVIARIRAARADRRVRAVILHVDSPGGSALASDRIHHELVQLAAEKPLVACMANVAASGGYYVAAAAREIVAEPTTITGSIGVVAARVVLEPLLARLGVVTEHVRRGARAGLLDPGRRLSEDEHAALAREIQGMYDAFVDVVAEGRRLPRDRVQELAQGRVWTGRDAADRKLVDLLGGFEVALDRARALTGYPRPAELRAHLIRAPRRPIPPLDPPRRSAAWLEALRNVGDRVGIDLSILPLAFGRDRVLAWCRISSWLR